MAIPRITIVKRMIVCFMSSSFTVLLCAAPDADPAGAAV
jgi:hypothetical protein